MKHRKKNKISICLYILIVSLLVVAVIFIYFKNNNNDVQAPSSASSSITEQVKTNNKTVDISENYFGDVFSSEAYINSNETNFFFDDITTAYTFTPVYDLKEVATTSLVASKNNFCLNSNCVLLKDKKLYFNGVLVQLPDELNTLAKKNKILNISIGTLDSKWLVGAVIGTDKDDYGLAYYFDGKNFQNLISSVTTNKIEPRYERLGGTIGFGGHDSDFIIFYSGYDGIAYRIKENNGQKTITDISDFFGLRLTDEGFTPQIISTGNGLEKTWFICGQNKNSFKFIKLWQNETDNIVGILDLGKDFLNIPLDNHDLSCVADFNDSHRVLLSFYTPDSKQVSSWKFIDQGFDNSHDYVATSKDLNTTGKNVVAVLVGGIKLNGDGKLVMSNNNLNWFIINKDKKNYFPSMGNNLYWKLEANKNPNKYYSPFFDGISPLTYYLGN